MNNFDESKHPRDNEGKFTFKKRNAGGNSKLNQENAILKGYYDKKTQQEFENDYKNKLLNILGNEASHADTLYGTSEKLEGKIEKLGGKFKEKLDVLKSKIYEVGLGIGYKFGSYQTAKKIYGPDTIGMIDLAHNEKMDKDYIKSAIKLQNFDDSRIAKDKKYLVNKLNEQYKDYIGKFNVEDVEGYYFKNDSEQSIRMSQNTDFRKTIKNNKEKLKNGIQFSSEFPHYSNNKQSNWHYALGHYDIRNSYIDENGNLRLKVYDTYDFNKENLTPLNQAGRNQMLKGTLKPYFSIHDIIIPKKELDFLWNKENE